MKCKNCNTEFSDSVKFCPNCGTQVQITTNNNYEDDADTKYNNMTLKELLSLEKKTKDSTVQSYIAINYATPLKMQFWKDNSEAEAKREILETLKRAKYIKWAKKSAENGNPRGKTLLAWKIYAERRNDNFLKDATKMFKKAEQEMGEETYLKWFKNLVSKLTDSLAITLLASLIESEMPKMAESAYSRAAEFYDENGQYAQQCLIEGIGNDHMPM